MTGAALLDSMRAKLRSPFRPSKRWPTRRTLLCSRHRCRTATPSDRSGVRRSIQVRTAPGQRNLQDAWCVLQPAVAQCDMARRQRDLVTNATEPFLQAERVAPGHPYQRVGSNTPPHCEIATDLQWDGARAVAVRRGLVKLLFATKPRHQYPACAA